jgi:putative ABC transport system permease protein
MTAESFFMHWQRQLAKLRALVSRRRRWRDLRDEMRAHLAMEEHENLEAGLPPAEAHYAALRRFGNVALAQERSREMWGWHSLESLMHDLRHGVRVLAKNPGFSVVAVLTLALGIGVNCTIFSVISTILLRKPPVPDPDRLMVLSSRNTAAGADSMASHDPVSPPDYLDWRAQATSYSGIAAASSFEDEDKVTLSGGSQPERVPAAQISANYFSVLGIAPVLGRDFVPGEDREGRDREVLLRADLWKNRFGSDPGVLGRTLKVNGEAYTVVGIMPDSLRRLWMFPEQLWIPLAFTAAQLGPGARSDRNLSVFGRLKPGVTEAQANSELETIARRVAAANPKTNQGWSANVLTLQQYATSETNAGTALVFLMAAVGFVLLIACANVANLMLARNTNRQREFAIRAALGAGRLRVARQLLSECLLLALLGGALGLLFATWGLHLLRGAFNWNEWSILIAQQLSIDRNVLLFTLVVSAGTAIIFGLAPAFRIARRDPNAGLKEGSRSATASREHHRLQNVLVAGQLALSMVLLVGAGLFAGSFIEEMRQPLGMNPHNLLTASVSLTGTAYKDAAHQAAFALNVLHRLQAYPEAQSAAVSTDLPYAFPGHVRIAIEGRPVPALDKQPLSAYYSVSPGYFTTAGIALREGREFTASDNSASPPVVIVNQAFAERFFPHQDPLGSHVSITRIDAARDGGARPQWSGIVGVIANVNEYAGQQAPRPQVFEPFLQKPDSSMDLLVRLRVENSAFAASLRQAVWSIDKDQAVSKIRSMDRVIQDSSQGDDIMAGLMGAFAGIALLIAAVGIYGLLAYLVGRRTHELGVRVALGARRHEVFWLVLGTSMRMVLAGAALGFAISLTLPRLVSASFQGFHVHSAWILAGTPIAVLLVALVSCYFPARRASRVDPMEALRCE